MTKVRSIELIAARFICLSILLLGGACGPLNTLRTTSTLVNLNNNARIVQGVAVPEGSLESLATVALYIPRGAGTVPEISIFCSGTLVRADLILTAAHCLSDFAKELKVNEATLAENIRVGFGRDVISEVTAQSRKDLRRIKSYAVHPQYVVDSIAEIGQKPMYDIALLRLSEPAPSPAKAAYLPVDRLALEKGQWIRLVGFGNLNGDSNKRAIHMMEANVIIDNPDFSRTQFTYSSQEGKGSCSGDSGGPAYYKTGSGELVVLGVTSWGDRRCQGSGAYTSVPYFLDWIKATAQQL